MVKISRNRMIVQRIYMLKAIARVDTQKIREDLLRSLQDLFGLAKRQAQNQKLQLPQRQRCVRVVSYVAQVMNSLTKSYDEAQIMKDLAILENMINEAVAKEESRGSAATG